MADLPMKEILQYTLHLKAQHQARNRMFDRMEEMILMVWPDESKVRKKMENAKVTMSPDARNAIIGALRLLIATDPVFSVPLDTNNANAKEQSETMEKWATAVWQAAGRVRQDPVHYDVVLSMLAFAEVHIPVTKTADMVEFAKGSNAAAIAKSEEIAGQTPYVFDVWDPRTGYPDIGPYGLTSYYREVKTKSGQVLDEFGSKAAPFFPDGNRYADVILCHFWDYENRVTWLFGRDRPLIQEKHGLPFIPVVVQLGEGSRLFSKPEYQRQPFLYTLWKSGLWERQNLSLTVLYTMLFALGSNPTFLYKTNEPEKELDVDWDTPGGIAKIMQGEDFGPVGKLVVQPEMWRALEVADQLVEESTIFSQTLGEPLGKNAPFSMVALLHQAGRLPLMVPQRKTGWGIADAVKIAMRWMAVDGKKTVARYKDTSAELAPADVPKHFELEATLDIALPTDRLQEANVARMLTEGEDPLVSQAWVLENVLNVGQPEEMKKQIWKERASAVIYQKYIMDMIAQARAREQQAMQPEAQPGGPPGMPPGQMPPPNGGPPPPTEQVGPGLPPEMFAGGGQPPQMPGQEGLP